MKNITETASFEVRPDTYNAITRYEVETLGLRLASQGHDLEELIHLVSEASCAEEAFDILAGIELSRINN